MTTQSGPVVGTSTSRPVLKNRHLSRIVLVIGLVITAAATLYLKSGVEKAAGMAFAVHCAEIENKILERLEDHARILKSGAAFFNATDSVTREEWRIYSQVQNIDKELPGVQGVGFSLLIPRKELAKHLVEIRSNGFPEYKVRPEGERELYSSIIYLEPFAGRNLRAFGYDMFSEPVRRKAMERARDTNNPALSGKVTLVQETDRDVQAGILMYVPVYHKGMPVETVEKRKAALYGWVYSPYRMKDLIQGILSKNDLEKEKKLHLKIFDGENCVPPALLFECHPDAENNLWPDVHFSRLIPVDINGTRWTLSFTQTGGGLFTSGYVRVWLTMVSGTIITLLLFFLTRALLSTRAEAERIAEHLTSDLKASEQFTTDIINSLSSNIAVLDSDGIIIAVNEPWQNFAVENSAPDVISDDIGKRYLDVFKNSGDGEDDEGAEASLAGIQAVLQGEQQRFILEYPCHSPYEQRWFRMIVSKLKGSRSGVVVSHADITDRKITESALQQVTQQQRALLDGAGIGIALIKDRHLKWTNSEFSNIFGYSEAELDNVCTELFYLSRDEFERDGKEAYPLMDSGERFAIESQMVRKDGTLFYAHTFCRAVNPGDQTAGYIWIISDETAKNALEQRLQQSHNLLTTLSHQIPGTIFQFQLFPDGRSCYPYASDAIFEMFEVTPEEVREDAAPLFARLHPDDSGSVRESIMESARTFQPLEHDYRVVLPLKGVWWRHGFSRPQKLDDGSILWHGFIHDITEQKHLQLELREARNGADLANRAKSEFLANMSHEIRTPMNGLLGMAQLLGMTGLSEEQQEYVAALKLSGKNLTLLVNDILDLSKIEAGKITIEPAEFDPRRAIDDVTIMQRSVIFDKKLALDIIVAEDMPGVIIGDQLRFKQILLNLIGNAAKFTKQGGITIAAKVLERQYDHLVMQISVADTGIGIAAEALKRIFKPFVQEDGSTTRQFGGTGLGLTISRRLAELMGGDISVESSQGVGSSFIVTLPFTIPIGQNSTAGAFQIAAPGWDGPSLRILMAEDNPVNLKFGTVLLGKHGHRVVTAVNGKECLEAMEQGTFDLVLMDIQMPVMNGEEVLRSIRAKEEGTSCHQRVIALTAHALRNEKVRFLSEGFDGYLSKPMEQQELIDEMKRVMSLTG